jgi:hypothetical protein
LGRPELAAKVDAHRENLDGEVRAMRIPGH